MVIEEYQVIGLDVKDDKNFSHHGCENCANGLGNDVTTCIAAFKNDVNDWDEFTIELCSECINAYYNGEELPEGCKNIYQI